MLGASQETIRFVALKAALVIGLLAVGCGGERADQKEKRLLKESGQEVKTLANVAGKVTIDRQAPAFGPEHPVQVILYDLNNPPTSARPPLYAICTEDGSFRFVKSTTEPGAPEGSYVLLFAALKHARVGAYKEPDSLNNLYNDPDKNQADPSFKIDLKAPGRTDFDFDLKLADRPPVAAPGPHAVAQLGYVKKKR